jgi:hypothetical protein
VAEDDNVATVTTSAQQRAERRWGARVEIDLAIHIEFAREHSAPARLRNVSKSGALIECSVELPVFTPLRVKIPSVADRIVAPIWLNARVVRAEHPHLGVEWRDFEPDSLVALFGMGNSPKQGSGE